MAEASLQCERETDARAHTVALVLLPRRVFCVRGIAHPALGIVLVLRQCLLRKQWLETGR